MTAPPGLRALAVLTMLATLAGGCSGTGSGTAPAPGPTASPSAQITAPAPATERVEASLWVSPDRSEAVVRTVIDDPIPTGAASIQLTGEALRLATDATLVVDGTPRAIQGTGLIPWQFGTDRRLELEVAFPVTPSTRWKLAGQMIDDWLPVRATVPRYFSRVTWDIQVHGPVEAAIGGDPSTCERPAPRGLQAAACVATIELGIPPLIYLPGPAETVRRSAAGYVELIGDLAPAVAEDLLGFAGEAVQALNAILGDVAPRRVAVVVGDVVGNFAGEAIGPMVVLDADHVRRQPDAARTLLAHELVHTAQEHRLAAPGRDPGSGMTESLAEYLGARLVLGDDLDLLRAQARNRGVGDADVDDVEGLVPRDAFGRRPPIGQDQLLATYEYQRRALVYVYLPRAWIDLHAHLGTARMDAFLRAMHTRPGLDWNIDQMFELAGEYGERAASILRGYWEEPVPADQETW
ncbi:MAG TPA: DUF4157 domain-containing protein [Nitriliruptorales bacterium]